MAAWVHNADFPVLLLQVPSRGFHDEACNAPGSTQNSVGKVGGTVWPALAEQKRTIFQTVSVG